MRSLIRNVPCGCRCPVSSVSCLAGSVWGAGLELAVGTVLVEFRAAKDTVSQRTKPTVVSVQFPLRLVLYFSLACSNYEPPNGSRYSYL
jgi:hypothetical protein